MRNLILLLALLFCLPLTCFNTYAQWYEARGHASFEKNSLEVARTIATENALKKALLIAGASVSSVQQVVNGLLTQDNISIRASGSVNSIELIDELHSGDTISVTIRADIIPQDKKCFALDLKKSLLFTKGRLTQREHANIGEIYNIDAALIDKINQQVINHSSYANPKLLLKSSTAFSRLNQSYNDEKIKQLVISLASNSDSQYVVFTEINDLSLTEQRSNSWQVWQQATYPRNFHFTLYLYNGLTGELAWQQTYQNNSIWDFNKRRSVDVNSSVFWQSEYGHMVNKLVEKAVTDIDKNIMCEPSEGKLLDVSGNQVVINLGRHHGVKIGDEFSLLHLDNFIADNGKQYISYNVSPYKVKVTKLTRQTANAVTVDNSLLGNIQQNDLAVRQ